MDVTLRVTFNSFSNKYFEIKNPVVLPTEGEVLNFDFADFLDDEHEISKLNGYDGIWLCNIVSKRYHKNGVDIQVVLFGESEYAEMLYGKTGNRWISHQKKQSNA